MNFPESEAYLLSLGNEVEAMKLGLDNIRTLLKALRNPQNNYKKVQVAGTNGKGSVCAFLNSICLQAGIRTGLYTSPHLISITERIKIDGEDISETNFARISTLVRETSEALVAAGELETVPTYFEQVTAMALVAFAEAKVELAILETGLGGRFDAVTAANAEIAAITRIDLDHQEYLGETIEKIAAEKAAIIRADSIVCVGRQMDDAYEVIKARCAEVRVDPITLQNSKFGSDQNTAFFVLDKFQFDEVMLSLPGDHQIENAALAVLIAKRLAGWFKISDENVLNGLEHASHPGRIELFEIEEQGILLDGAHNLSGAKALAAYLIKSYPETNIALVYGSMNDKDLPAILGVLSPLASEIILTEPKNSRSASAEEMREIAKCFGRTDDVFSIPNVESALDAGVQLAKNFPATRPSLVVVTGSLHLVGEARKLLVSGE